MNLELINRIYYLEKEIERLETLETPVVSGESVIHLIETQRLTAQAASIVFSSIPSTYTHLLFVGSLRTMNVWEGDTIYMSFNNIALPNAAFVATDTRSEGSNFFNTNIAQRMMLSISTDSAGPAGFYSPFNLWCFWYGKTDRNRISKSLWGAGTDITAPDILAANGSASSMWIDTASVVNRVDFIPASAANFAAGCMVSLFGVN